GFAELGHPPLHCYRNPARELIVSPASHDTRHHRKTGWRFAEVPSNFKINPQSMRRRGPMAASKSVMRLIPKCPVGHDKGKTPSRLEVKLNSANDEQGG